jgi:predicted nucleotidyltransferase
MLSLKDLNDALTELGRRAHAQGKVVEIAIYGGSALMLASNFRVTTQDVDAVADTNQGLVNRLAQEIGAERGWPQDWLNDGVRTYLSPNVEGLAQHHELFRTYPSEDAPGLRVFVPTPEYLLAMKLMALRLDPAAGKTDLSDILNLMEVVNIADKEQLNQFAAMFYPEARVSGRLRLGLDILWAARLTRSPSEPHAPRYLGRSGTASKRR